MCLTNRFAYLVLYKDGSHLQGQDCETPHEAFTAYRIDKLLGAFSVPHRVFVVILPDDNSNYCKLPYSSHTKGH